jgi:8-oxo-dGTP pyrophosphatase MutT (NUDIX family)
LPGEEPHRGALRELLEETGLEGRVVDIRSTPDVNTSTVAQLPSPFCILAEPIPGSAKEEDHLHLDFVYVLEVDPLAPLTPLADEVDHAVWIDGGHIDELDTFENVRRVCQAIRILSHQNTETFLNLYFLPLLFFGRNSKRQIISFSYPVFIEQSRLRL